MSSLSPKLPDPAGRPFSRSRLRQWMRALYHDPTSEERAMEERRQSLLDELNRAVREAPDDVPIRNLIERLNQHRGD